MDTKLLIDGIVRQTTVLIAQLSTAAGIRSSLAHVADQVFVDLAREIEVQGVARKVAADMFGMTLRAYQKKMRRLEDIDAVRGRSLWEAVIALVTAEGPVARGRVEERFRHDDPLAVGAVLSDLVHSGLLYATGRGPDTLYGLTSASDRQRLLTRKGPEVVSSLIWMRVYDEPCRREVLAERLPFDEQAVSQAVDALLSDGRVDMDEDGVLRARQFVVPFGAQGWETAVFDHFRAVATAIGTKVRGRRSSRLGDVVGGSTLSFDLHPEHPHKDRVLALLARVRDEVLPLWEEVAAHNRAQPIDDAVRSRVYFYFGQYAEDAGDELGCSDGLPGMETQVGAPPPTASPQPQSAAVEPSQPEG